MWTRRWSRDLSEREAGLCFVLPLSLTYIRSLSVCRLALCLYCTYTSLQSRPRCHPRVVCWIITAATRADSDIHKSWAQIKKDECKPETETRGQDGLSCSRLSINISCLQKPERTVLCVIDIPSSLFWMSYCFLMTFERFPAVNQSNILQQYDDLNYSGREQRQSTTARRWRGKFTRLP